MALPFWDPNPKKTPIPPSVPKLPVVKPKTTVPVKPKEPFWKTQEFKTFLGTVKVGVGARVGVPVEGVAHVVSGPTTEQFQSEAEKNNLDFVIKVLNTKQRVIYESLPKNVTWQIPSFDPALEVGDLLYFDKNREVLTGNDSIDNIPMYFVDKGDYTLTPNITKYPAQLNPESAIGLFGFYNTILKQMPDLVANLKLTEKGTPVDKVNYVKPTIESQGSGLFDWRVDASGKTFTFNKGYGTGKEQIENITFRETNAPDVLGFVDRSKLMLLGGLAENVGWTKSDIVSMEQSIQSGMLKGLFDFLGDKINYAGRLVASLWQTFWYATLLKYDIKNELVRGESKDVDAVTKAVILAERNMLEEETRKHGVGSYIPSDQNKAFDAIVIKNKNNSALLNTIEFITTVTKRKDLPDIGLSPDELGTVVQYKGKAAEIVQEAYILAAGGNTLLAIEKLVESYSYRRQAGIMWGVDLYASYDFIDNSELQNQFMHGLAQVELQKGSPLTPKEIEQVRYKYENATAAFIGSALVDQLSWTNLSVKTLKKVMPAKMVIVLSKVDPMIWDKSIFGAFISDGITKVVLPSVKKALKIPADFLFPGVVDNLVSDILKWNLDYKGAIYKSTNGLVKLLAQDMVDLMTEYGGSIKTSAKFESYSSIINMAKITAKGLVDDLGPDEILDLLKNADGVSAWMATQNNVKRLIRAVKILDPLSTETDWGMILLAPHKAIVDSRAESITKELNKLLMKATDNGSNFKKTELALDEVGNTINVPFHSGNPAIDTIIRDTLNSDLDTVARMLEQAQGEILALARRTAENTITIGNLGDILADVVGGRFKDGMRAWENSQVMKDNLTGFIGSALAPKLGNTATKVIQDLIDGWSKIYSKGFNWWVNNIIARSPRFSFFYQPMENITTYVFAGKGSLGGRLYDIVNNSEEIIGVIEDMPAVVRSNYVSLGMFEIDTTTDMIKYWKENSSAWLNSPASYAHYFKDAAKRKQIALVDELLGRHGISEVGDRVTFLEEAAKRAGEKGIIWMEDGQGGKIAVFMGKPVTTPGISQLRTLGDSTSFAGKMIATQSEVMVKANVAYEAFIDGLEQASDSELNNFLVRQAAIMKRKGASDDAIESYKVYATSVWNGSRGDPIKAYNVVGDVKGVVEGNAFRTAHPIPKEVYDSLSMFSSSEKETVLGKVQDAFSDFHTSRRINGLPINEDSYDEFFDSYFKKVIYPEVEGDIDPNGQLAQLTFGNRAGTHPVSLETGKLLDAFEDGKAPQHYTVDIKQLFLDNGVNTEGKKIGEAFQELHSNVRPDISVPSVTKTADDIKKAVEDNVPYDVIRSTYIPEDSPMFPNILTSIAHNQTGKVEAGIRPVLLDEYEALFPENEKFIQWHNYSRESGKVQGTILNLRDAAFAGDEEAKVFHNLIFNTLDNQGRYNQLMNGQGGFYKFVFPRYKTKAEAAKLGEEYIRTIAHAHYELTAGLSDMAYKKEAEYLQLLNASISGNTQLPPMSIGGFFETNWGIKSVVDSDGFTIKEFQLFSANGEHFTTFKPGDGIYEKIQDPSFFGLRNADVLNAPLSSSADELKALHNKSFPLKPVIPTTPETIDLHRKAFFNNILNSSFDTRTHKSIIQPIIQPLLKVNQTIDDLSSQEIIDLLKKVAENKSGNQKQVMVEFAQYLQDINDYFYDRYILGNVNAAIPWTPNMLPPAERAWVAYVVDTTAKADVLKNAMDKWKEIAKAELGKKAKLSTDLAVDTVKQANHDLVNSIAEMRSKLWYGGKTASGINLEGAIPFMKQRMRVMDENVIDQAIKGIIPFWGFASRGAFHWLNVVMEHPNILAAYNRYLAYSRGRAYETGAVNSKGQQLPSTVGKIPISLGGTLQWYNPLATSPFLAYYFPSEQASKFNEDEDGLTDFQKFWQTTKTLGQSRGVRISPIFDMILSVAGVENIYTTQNATQKAMNFGVSLFLPSELIPPGFWNMVDGTWRKMTNPDNPETWRPEVQWFDQLVETQMHEEYLDKMSMYPDTIDGIKQKTNLNDEMQSALLLREKSSIWMKYLNDMRNTDYFKQLSGYMTGVYTTAFTSADADVAASRAKDRMLKQAISNQLLADVFQLDPDPVIRESNWKDSRYNSPEGALLSIRNIFGWVYDPITGKIITGKSRRDEIHRRIDAENKAQSHYTQRQQLDLEYDNKKRSIPVGREYSDPRARAYREEYWNKVTALDNQGLLSDSSINWSPSYKPKVRIIEHYSKVWWRLLNAIRPVRNYEINEKWTDWEQRVRDWEVALPQLAEELKPIFTFNIMQGSLISRGNQDVLTIIEQVVKDTSPEFYYKWDLSRDYNPVDGVMRAWEVNVLSPYMNVVSELKGSIREEASRQWLRTHPIPTTNQVILLVKQIYGNKWTDDEIRNSLMRPSDPLKMLEEQSRQILGVTEALTIGKTDDEAKRSAIYDIWNRIPMNERGVFVDVFRKNGGVEKSLTIFFGTIGPTAFIDIEEFRTLHDVFAKTAVDLKYTKPMTDQQVTVAARAQRLNDNLGNLLTTALGSEYDKIVGIYQGIRGRKDKNKWASANPAGYNIVKRYNEIIKQFGQNNKLWLEYYGSAYDSDGKLIQKKTIYVSSVGGVTPAKSTGSGGIVQASTPQATITSPIGIPMRSASSAQEVMAGMSTGSGQFSSELLKLVGGVLAGELSDVSLGRRKSLSNSARAYLKKVAISHPELRNEIDSILSRY